jgi:peptidylprolyl isomerase
MRLSSLFTRLLFAGSLAASPALAAVPADSVESFLATHTYKQLLAKARYGFSGLQFVELRKGQGPLPKKGDVLKVHYTGVLTDGRQFDSSRQGGPFQFTIGAGEVIQGWDAGLLEMRKGDRRILIVPPEMGYGAQGSGPIPPNATLLFDVELLDF